MFLNQDYRSRAIGIVAAIGVLITGVAVNAMAARAPHAKPKLELVDSPVDKAPKSEYYC